MAASNRKVLRKLKIDEFSLVDVPASEGSDVLIWKKDDGMSAEAVAKRLTDEANAAVDEALALLDRPGRENVEKAGKILERSPEIYAAYEARRRGERWQAPVRKAEDEPDHRAEIRKLASEGRAGVEKLGQLLQDPAAYRQYRELTEAGAFVPAA